MKFCEKLQKLRKEKGYSQEQLADLLDVSRQSVSKWESGTTYPEMDKLLSLCKIFDVTLDDLTNDEITDKTIKEKSKNNFSSFVYAILDMINKSIEMFKNMNKKEVIKCISELFILVIILLIFKFPFNYIDSLAKDIFINFSDNTFNALNSIWLFLSNTIYLILFITIFIYVYKIRFLDKYNYETTLKNKEKETSEMAVDPEEKNIELPSKTREKHSFILFDVLGSIFNIFIKICLLFIVVPLIICFIFLVICTTITLIIQFLGIHYIGVFIALIGATLAVGIIMELFIRFLLSSTVPFKRMFSLFLIGIITFGVGSGLTTYEVSKIKFYDEIPENIQKSKIENTYDMSENLFFRADLYTDGINYKIDDTLSNKVKVEIAYYEDFLKVDTHMEDEFYVINSYSLWNNTINYLDILKNDLKNKTIYNYELLGKADITITASSANIDIIKKNSQSYYEKLHENTENYYIYQEEIYNLQEELQNKNNENARLREKINELQAKLDNINSVIG